MAVPVIQGDAVVLLENVIYRARLEVVPPFGPAATEGAVAEELAKQGFANIRFYEKGKLPADWPSTEAVDDSGFLGKSYYLEGRFTLSGRRIPLTELGTKVALKGMWVHLVPTSVPVPGTPLPPRLPPSGSALDWGEQGSKIVVGWLAAGAAYGLTRRLLRRRRSARR